MSAARWNLTGILGVLLLAAAWVAWGLSGHGGHVAAAQSELIGSWTVTQLVGEPPGGTEITRIDIESTARALRVRTYATYGGSEYAAGEWRLVPVVGDPTAWDAPGFRVVLHRADVIELTNRPDRAAAGDPAWRAEGKRRTP